MKTQPSAKQGEADKVQALDKAIRAELRARQEAARGDPLTLVVNGRVEEALVDLIFFSNPGEASSAIQSLLAEIGSRFASAPTGLQRDSLLFLSELATWLRSALPRWNLQNASAQGEAALPQASIDALAERCASLAIRLAKGSPHAESELLEAWSRETSSRLKAEGVTDYQGEAKDFVGDSLESYLLRMDQAVSDSNLRKIAEMGLDGLTPTHIGNDYAAFLRHAMFLGASFVACNPPLVDLAWQADPGHWDPIIDDLIRANPDADPDELAKWATLEIVLANMRVLRPVFLLTGGKIGCVCLQVNPHRHGDALAMVSDARSLYAELRRRLSGGVPNVVFKLPATLAGLHACRELTAEGIGVTITVTFGLYQHLTFASALQGGQAILSTLAHMSGRLAFPIRDELLSKSGELERLGFGEAQLREAAAWSGVAVHKRLLQTLEARGIDTKRVRPLIASLRFYTGPGYEALPSPFPDITETIGTGIVTVFPNIRHAFDAQPAMTLDPGGIARPVPEHVFGVLRHSQIFRQAYWVPELGDDDGWRPEAPFTLEDAQANAAWPPVSNTLNEFMKAYDTFVDRILARREAILPRMRA